MALRPINDTRGADGRFTSETAFRLNQRKAGLAGARANSERGFPNLKLARRQRSINTARRRLAKIIRELVEYGLIVINPHTPQQVTPEMFDARAQPSRRKT
jgi:hypothetical protein